MMKQVINNLKRLIQEEERCSQNVLYLTANENVLSKLCLSFLSSHLSQRYYFKGNQDGNVIQFKDSIFRAMTNVHQLECIADTAANKMFHSIHNDFRLLSGMHATISLLTSLTEVGDLIYTLNPSYPGHPMTAGLVTSLGRRFQYIPWDEENYDIDLDKFSQLYRANKPKLIVLDFSSPLFPLNIAGLRSVIDEDTLLAYDGSHVLGLIGGDHFQAPLVEGADVLLGSTHKTLFGPQKALIGFKDKALGNKFSESVESLTVSNTHTHHIIALCLSLLELEQYGKEYANQVISNANALGAALEQCGFSMLSHKGKYSDSHIIMLPFSSEEACQEACRLLQLSNISVNIKQIHGTSMVRLGVQELTRLGMKKNEMQYIAELFHKVLLNKVSASKIKSEVSELKGAYREVCYSFDKYIE